MLVGGAVARLAKPVIVRVLRADASADPRIDYRLVAFGAILPDLIDKPLAWVFFPSTFSDLHLYGHTILFGAGLTVVGLALARKGDLRLLLVGIGTVSHLPVDPVARNASTLLWPLLGTEFDSTRAVVPYSYVIDFAFLLILALLATSRTWRERMRRFVRTGEVPGG